MLIISHRGNLNGADEKLENNPSHILKLTKRLNVEIDLWFVDNELFLGHDNPIYKINESFFNSKMWIHCKNIEAAQFMSEKKWNWFWHDNDKMTITSKGYIWCYPNIFLKNGITVMKNYQKNIPLTFGICTDHVNEYL
jgi:hypothetical protein